MKFDLQQLTNIVSIPKGPVIPSKYPEEEFMLYSLPAYDSGHPQRARGTTIKSSKTLVQTGDVLVSKLNPRIPRVWLVEQSSANRSISSTEFVPFRIIDTERYESQFLAFMLLAPQFIGELASQVRSSTGSHQRVRPSDILNKKIPVPPLEEQRRIVARIKECMERVEEIERLRSEANAEREALFESTIEAAFSGIKGKEVSLDKVCSIDVPLVDPRRTENLDKLHVGGANIETATGRLLNLRTSREEELKSNKFPFDASMVLYNKIRPYLKKVARPDFDGICSADMYPLSPKGDYLLRDYLFYLLLSRNFTEYAIDGSNRAGMPKVNRNHLFAYKFELPGVDQQRSIVEALNGAFDALLTLRETISEGADERLLRDAILRKAFAGEL